MRPINFQSSLPMNVFAKENFLDSLQMGVGPPSSYPIPEETQRVAKAIFPDGNLVMRMRDELGELYADGMFQELFPSRGQLAESPGRLALVTVLQTVFRFDGESKSRPINANRWAS
jgi:hypothetical protein